MEVPAGKKIYFLSDFHLGAPDYESSLKREKIIVAFLESIRPTALAIFIVGDMFDFWFEYKQVTPKGYVRLLGKLAEITDSGIPIHFFVGNHDMWMRGYFEKELNIPVYFEPKTFEWNGKRFFIGHGDGLGPGDSGYKLMKKVFRNRMSQLLFGMLHPSWGIGLANFFSRKSRQKTGSSDDVFLGEENEWLVIFSKQVLAKEHYDYFIFGHRHLPLDVSLSGKSRYINLGDWIKHFTFAEFDGNQTQLKKLDQLD
ncbi:UDP-2,3-diacylglucosamine diphosphatase [Segetibacter sp.]|jgi:UDP-2,3-diacylglucosamine hydrolase|uniref:UDP-2,3-diacylglucosamine diphosphatase n=1 Tax=Segetibacter sp. TaxID=2231182 RepID=UPI002635D1B4|nr:UDP-2,3-diacylglucosamine diphosphatase [Segetibacter sp.]MCW3079306.1 UDP-2,3-diacylglucosamine diphosphatase [Segetibacter sp.]